MKIIELKATEAGRLVPLLQELHAVHVLHQPKRHAAAPTDQSLEDWLRDWLKQEGVTALVAESPQGALLGYLLYAREDRAALPVRAAETRLMLHHISVAPPFQRMGVGLALVNEVKQRAKAQGIDVLSTSYAPFNTASAALFQALGLEPVLTMAELRI